MHDYDGYRLELASKTKVAHRLLNAQGDPWIVLQIEDPFGAGLAASLSPDDALQLATTLLRDVSLARFGHG